MERSRPVTVVILLLALRLPGQQVPPEMQKLLDVKQHARVWLSDVPNYSCLETIDRSWQQSVKAVPERDILHVEVSVDRNRESFAAPGSKSAATGNLATLSERGLTATGLFSMFSSGLFTTSSAAIYGAEAGDQVLRYDFHVPPADSAWRLMGGGASAQVGERGFFTVDAHSLRLLNVEVNADEIPSFLRFVSVRVFIDYSAGTVSGLPTLVPSSAEMWTKERSGELHDDRFFFSQCRKFSAASTVYFEASEAGAFTHERGAQGLSMLPSGLTVPIELLASVDSAKAAPGDEIRAAISRDLLWKGKVLIRKGTPIEGHVRAGTGRVGPNANGVVIEFDQVATEAGSADFLAEFESGSLGEGANQAVKSLEDSAGALSSRTYFAKADIPGVVSFVKFGDGCVLPRGMRMEWKVQDLRQVRNASADRSPLGTDPRFFGRGSPLYPY